MKLKPVNILFLLGFIGALLLSGCGGGFGSDSEQADELGELLFGPDSTY